MYASLTILAAFVFTYSVVAGRIEKMAISGPIVFTAFGLVMGPLGMNLLKINVNGEGMRTLAELTQALVVVWTVFLSILVHGFSANPLVTALGKSTNPGK